MSTPCCNLCTVGVEVAVQDNLTWGTMLYFMYWRCGGCSTGWFDLEGPCCTLCTVGVEVAVQDGLT